MGKIRISVISLSLALFAFASGCQKMKPEIFLLGTGQSSLSPTANDPKAGRVTAGSSDVQTAGSYRLKGRVSFVSTGAPVTSGGYKLTGTVKF